MAQRAEEVDTESTVMDFAETKICPWMYENNSYTPWQISQTLGRTTSRSYALQKRGTNVGTTENGAALLDIAVHILLSQLGMGINLHFLIHPIFN